MSPAGVAQAEDLAAELANRRLDRIFASDSLRAAATARIIAKAHGLPVRTDKRLQELDFGEWEGRRLAELWAEEPEAARGWEADFWTTPASFGESVHELNGRVREFWAESLAHVDAEVVVVAHRGSLAVLRALITGTALERAFADVIEMGTAIWLETGG